MLVGGAGGIKDSHCCASVMDEWGDICSEKDRGTESAARKKEERRVSTGLSEALGEPERRHVTQRDESKRPPYHHSLETIAEQTVTEKDEANRGFEMLPELRKLLNSMRQLKRMERKIRGRYGVDRNLYKSGSEGWAETFRKSVTKGGKHHGN